MDEEAEEEDDSESCGQAEILSEEGAGTSDDGDGLGGQAAQGRAGGDQGDVGDRLEGVAQSFFERRSGIFGCLFLDFVFEVDCPGDGNYRAYDEGDDGELPGKPLVEVVEKGGGYLEMASAAKSEEYCEEIFHGLMILAGCFFGAGAGG